MARVLVIEDEADLQEILRYNLGQAGHEVRVAGTGKEGLRLAREQLPDIVLQDATTKGIHVVMVTAKGEEIDRVVGFELGADDYVVKPFSVRELVLRMQAVMRRTDVAHPSSVIVFGSLRIDRHAHRVWVASEEIALTALEFKLLVTLYDRQNRVQTRSSLLSDVWGIDADIETRTVDTHVKRLREKLAAAGQYIETVRGVGYRFSEEPSGD
jgi:two-component system phosphate regulon response regulator PhoB